MRDIDVTFMIFSAVFFKLLKNSVIPYLSSIIIFCNLRNSVFVISIPIPFLLLFLKLSNFSFLKSIYFGNYLIYYYISCIYYYHPTNPTFILCLFCYFFIIGFLDNISISRILIIYFNGKIRKIGRI